MSNLLPSEMHRLVLGYLLEQGACPDTADRFLRESRSLAEVAAARDRMAAQGETPSSRRRFRNHLIVAGKSLVDMLEEYQE